MTFDHLKYFFVIFCFFAMCFLLVITRENRKAKIHTSLLCSAFLFISMYAYTNHVKFTKKHINGPYTEYEIYKVNETCFNCNDNGEKSYNFFLNIRIKNELCFIVKDPVHIDKILKNRFCIKQTRHYNIYNEYIHSTFKIKYK